VTLRGKRSLRALDRYVGIPVVAIGGAVKRRRRPLPTRLERIGIVNSTNVGDTVLLSAVVRDIGAAYPDAETILFASDETLPLVRLIPEVRAVRFPISRPRDATRALRRERLDVILDFDQWPRVEPLYCMLSGAHWSAGFRARGQHRHYWYDGVVDHSDRLHELENYRRLAALLGVESRSSPHFSPSRVPRSDGVPRPYVIFHLWPTGVRSELREWPWDRWRELACRLTERNFKVVLTGSAADAPRTADFLDFCGPVARNLVNRAGTYDLAQMVGVLCESSCVVSVNTGVMHLAAASGAPTVALNGPTAQHRWGPVGERVRSVNSEYEGCGYLHFGWEYRGRRTDCMHGISGERVLDAVLGLIGDR
jgi:heptosyltransferase I